MRPQSRFGGRWAGRQTSSDGQNVHRQAPHWPSEFRSPNRRVHRFPALYSLFAFTCSGQTQSKNLIYKHHDLTHLLDDSAFGIGAENVEKLHEEYKARGWTIYLFSLQIL